MKKFFAAALLAGMATAAFAQSNQIDALVAFQAPDLTNAPNSAVLGDRKNALNLDTKAASLRGVPVALTAREYNVLYALLLRKNSIVTRAQIEETLYGWGDEVESNAIEVYIHNLRKKLGGERIVTVRGLGYRLKHDGD